MDGVYCVDNLEYMRTLDRDSIDLIYIDPPFNTKKRRVGTAGSYEDSWNSIEAYVEWLRPRLEQMYRLLKPTGSFYCHLDWHAVHYVKVLLDKIFGYKRFCSEIIWKRKTGSNATKPPRRFSSNTDTILFYSKPERPTFNPQYTVYNPDYIKKTYRHDDKNGKGFYCLDNLSAPSYSPSLVYDYKGYKPPKKGWRFNLKRMKQMDKEGRLHFPSKDKRMSQKRYLKEVKGQPVTNIWTDIPCIQSNNKERTNYPTQKPLALLERIIKSSSNEGDTVADFFCGSGTTLVAAKNLGRTYLGVDASQDAVDIAKKRLADER